MQVKAVVTLAFAAGMAVLYVAQQAISDDAVDPYDLVDDRDFDALADEARLDSLISACDSIKAADSSDYNGSVFASGERVECLLQAAVQEFDANLSSPDFTTAEFSERLQEGARSFSNLYIGIHCRDRMGYICGSMAVFTANKAEEEFVHLVLNAIWHRYGER